MLSYSVVFTKKINLLILRRCFFEKFRNFLEKQKQQPGLFCKNDVLKYFTKFTEKRLCWSLFLIRLLQASAFRTAALLKETPAQVFFCEYCETFKNMYFEEHLQGALS